MRHRNAIGAILTIVMIWLPLEFSVAEVRPGPDSGYLPEVTRPDAPTAGGGATRSGSDAIPQMLSPGFQLGLTTNELQHLGTMGRQIATSFSGGHYYLHFVWNRQTNYIIPGNLSISYGYYNTAPFGSGGSAFLTGYYPTCDVLPDNRVIVACDTAGPATKMYLEAAAYGSSFSGLLTDASTAWPQIDLHQGTSLVTYVVAHANAAKFALDQGYLRNLIVYRRVGAGAWSGPFVIDKCTNLAYTVVADPNSDRVAVIYTDDRAGLPDGGGGETDLDVYYRLSNNQGSTWQPRVNVTNYGSLSPHRAYMDLSGLFTPDGALHIIWSARELTGADPLNSKQSHLMHWTSLFPSQVHGVARALYDMVPSCDPGQYNLYIAKPSLSWCENRLYALWTQFGADPYHSDCSAAGYANGELYVSVSADSGRSWDLPQDVTNTYTPYCASNECQSEHWASMIPYGRSYPAASDTLDILYISDRDAGAVTLGEGSWTLNPVLYLTFPCRAQQPNPYAPLFVVAYSPVNIIVEDPDQQLYGKDAHGTLIDQISPAAYFETPADHDSVVIYEPKEGRYIIHFVTEEGTSLPATYSAIIHIDGTQATVIVANQQAPASGKEYSYSYNVNEDYYFLNGDANGDNALNIGDAIYVINYVFKGGPAPNPVAAGDANCDTAINVGDAVYIVNYVFKGGQAPCYFER